MGIRKPQSRNAGQTTLRHVWLAGLGVASLVRRDTIKTGDRVLAQAARMQQRARGVADLARRVLARGPLGPAIARFEDGIGTWLAPAMRKLALQPRANPGKQRRPAARKTARVAAALQSHRKR
jgi:hypothetical protein